MEATVPIGRGGFLTRGVGFGAIITQEPEGLNEIGGADVDEAATALASD